MGIYKFSCLTLSPNSPGGSGENSFISLAALFYSHNFLSRKQNKAGNKTQTSLLRIILVSVFSQGQIDRLRMAPKAKTKTRCTFSASCDRKLKGCHVGQVSPTLTGGKNKTKKKTLLCFLFFRRDGDGVRVFWDRLREPSFSSRWNPFSNDFPFTTFTHHPVRNIDTLAAFCDVGGLMTFLFLELLVQTL